MASNIIGDIGRHISGFLVRHELALLDLEWSRMTAEDLRSASISPYAAWHVDGTGRLLGWREFAEERKNMCRELHDELSARVRRS